MRIRNLAQRLYDLTLPLYTEEGDTYENHLNSKALEEELNQIGLGLGWNSIAEVWYIYSLKAEEYTRSDEAGDAVIIGRYTAEKRAD